MAKIALFGGAFDPIHRGHLAVANCALRTLQFDQVRFIPCASPVHKAHCLATPEQRASMIALAIESQPAFVLDTSELTRATPSYAIDTIEHFLLNHGTDQVAWLIGADALLNFKTWHRWQAILEKVDLIVVNRAGVDRGALQVLEDELAAALKAKGHQLHHLIMKPETAASSAIRQHRAAFDDLPAAVRQYIEAERLY